MFLFCLLSKSTNCVKQLKSQICNCNFSLCVPLGHIEMVNSKMALVIGHSQTKYFKKYFDSKDNVEVLCYPGFKVEDLVLKDEVAEAVPRASVSTCILIILQLASV